MDESLKAGLAIILGLTKPRRVCDASRGSVFIGRNQADLLGYGLADEGIERGGIGPCYDASDDVALSLDGPNNDVFAGASRTFGTLVGCRFLFLPPT
jgi:hypothetical protein